MKVLVALLLAMSALPSSAQPVPGLLPTRDVTVTYRASGPAADAVPGGLGGLLHLSWQAAGQRLRVESDARPQLMLIDLGARSAQVLDRGLHTALTLPVRDRDLDPFLHARLEQTRQAPERVAGVPCRVHTLQSGRSRGTACVTEDGVVLRADGQIDGRPGQIVAVSVRYGPVAPGLFQVPPGYFQFAIPSGRQP